MSVIAFFVGASHFVLRLQKVCFSHTKFMLDLALNYIDKL